MGGGYAGAILVVEDDADLRFLIAESLTDEGYAVVTAPHGAAALDCVAQARPRAILLDMRMPVMDGWAFAQAYRERPGPHAPLIVCTAAHDAAARGAEVGAAATVAKPFGLAELLATVRRVLAATGER
jgi:CheY-like chemotaxis protein